MKVIAILSLAILLVECVLKEKLQPSENALLEHKAGQKKVFVLTWNQEVELPDDDTLTKISNKIKALNPDLIVFGFQEAKTYNFGKQRFLASKLKEDQFMGQSYKKLKNSAHFDGVTKASQIFKGLAHQALQVMVRKDDSTTTANMKGKRKSAGKEKGFCQAEVTLGGKKLVFVSTHLEVKESKRAQDITNIQKEVPASYDAYFLMGDLNYRLRKTADKAESAILNDMVSPSTRAILLSNFDTFNTQHFTSLPVRTWLQFDAKQNMPTYKRIKAAKGKTALGNIKKLGQGSNSNWDGQVDKQTVKDVYFPLKTKATNWDLGWLDRIGYGVKQGSSLKVASDVKMQVWSDIPFGDHTPVVALFTISGF